MFLSVMNGQVHIIFHDSLLVRGLERLLAEADVSFRKIDLQDPAPVDMLLRSMQPGDVVLMEQQGYNDRSWEQAMLLLGNLPTAALVVVDTSSSQVQFFLRQRCVIDTPEELARVIHWWGQLGRHLCSACR
jgi:hypothetical protein